MTMTSSWSEIFEVESAIKALGEAAGSLAKVESIFTGTDEDASGARSATQDAREPLNSAMVELRDWVRSARVMRENEDAMRKKALA